MTTTSLAADREASSGWLGNLTARENDSPQLALG